MKLFIGSEWKMIVLGRTGKGMWGENLCAGSSPGGVMAVAGCSWNYLARFVVMMPGLQPIEACYNMSYLKV